MTALQKLLYNFRAALVVHFTIAFAIFEDIVYTKFIDVIHFNFTFFPIENRRILLENSAVVSEYMRPGYR